ncbi:IclR family transcriptional regulator C-terminal domain-containing protein [Streptomyces sp. NPDC050617]|uniref:IclR family transcriptional regulator n=1 Tax=Streptomyces sp. NPDC050617 TaxID=3154628 RepID=UPI00344A9864
MYKSMCENELPPLSAPVTAHGGRLAGRLLSILKAVRACGESATLTQVVHLTGLAKTTAHRLLADLQDLDMVSRSGECYRLGAAVRELAVPREEQHTRYLRYALKPLLLPLYEKTRYVVGLGVQNGNTVRFIELIYSEQYSPVIGRLEKPVPLLDSAAGKALLAYPPARYAPGPGRKGGAEPLAAQSSLGAELTRIRNRGIALDERAAPLGLSAAAAPLFGPRGQPLAALSIGAAPEVFDLARGCALLRHAGPHARRILQRTSVAVAHPWAGSG